MTTETSPRSNAKCPMTEGVENATQDRQDSKAAVRYRDSRGMFVKGGPGRLPGTRNVQGLLEDAIKKAAKTRARLQEPCECVKGQLGTPAQLWAHSCKELDEHFARMAMIDSSILTAMMKKRVPDLQQQTGNVQPVAVHIHYGHEQARVQVVQPLSHA